MWYINKQPNEFGNFGNPQCNNIENQTIELPEIFLNTYIQSQGFVYIDIDENNIITNVVVNQEAYDNYLNSLPEPEPYQPTEEDDIMNMLVDQEYRITLLELGFSEEDF